MLNLKKGLALVLAAATAFTFAPVANLGNPYVAEAAQDPIAYLDFDFAVVASDGDTTYHDNAGAKTEITVDNGDYIWIAVPKYQSGAKVNIKSSDASVLSFVKKGDLIPFPKTNNSDKTKQYKFGVDGDNTEITDGQITVSEAQAKATVDYYGGTEYVVAKVAEAKAGSSASISVTSDDGVFENTIVATVGSKSFSTSKVTDIHIDNQTLWTSVSANGKRNLAYYVNTPSYDDFQHGKPAIPVTVRTEGDGVYFTLTSSNPKVIEVLSKVYSAEKSNKGNALGEFDITDYSVKGTGTSEITVNFWDSEAKHTNLGTYTFTITVNDAVATLKASYDPNEPGKTANVQATATYDQILADKSGAHIYANAVPTIYLDTVKNTSTKIKAEVANILTTHYNNGTSTVAPIFNTKNGYVSVDRAGNVSVSVKTNDVRPVYRDVIRISVPSVYGANGASVETGSLEIDINVVITTRELTSLSVRSGLVDLGKALGAANKTANELTLSNIAGRGNTAVLDFTSNVADSYIDAAVYTDDSASVLSDLVSYNAATKTLTAKANRTGRAYVVVSARADSNKYGTAEVGFWVNVSSKPKQVIEVRQATVTLNVTHPTADLSDKAVLAATGSSLTFKFEDTNAKTSDDKKTQTLGSLTLDVEKGIVTYDKKSDGQAYVLVSTNANDNTEAADFARILVKYSKTEDQKDSALDLSTQKITLTVGETRDVEFRGAVDPSKVTFASDNESVAVVSGNSITAVAPGDATITVSEPETPTVKAGSKTILVHVNAASVEPTPEPVVVTKPKKVTGVKVVNKKGAKVQVKWTRRPTAAGYQISYTTGGETVRTTRKGNKASIAVASGKKVTVKVRAYKLDENGKKIWGKWSAKVSKTTDKK